ncbi:MAG: lysophospholipid acyltransferase family protein [Phycisphaerae bacterium]
MDRFSDQAPAHHAVRTAAAATIRAVARTLTGARARWLGCGPTAEQRIYFANHASHGDFVLIWTALPPALRRRTRPVAGDDYWGRGRLRSFIGRDVFDAVLIPRGKIGRGSDPTAPVLAALDAGSSIIIFPEGTRNTTDAPLLPFRSGLWRLAKARPQAALIPVWIENVGRVMPKGEVLPVPLLCSVTFGAPLALEPGETRPVFLARAEAAVRGLAPAGGRP